MKIVNIGIIANPNKPGAKDTILKLINELDKHGISHALELDTAKLLQASCNEEPKAIESNVLTGPELASSSDIIVVLGGDGTMLDAAHRLGHTDTPIAGINIGTLGFLTACTNEEIPLFVQAVLDQSYHVIPRLKLDATIHHADGSSETHTALNEITLNRGITGRLVELEALIDGALLNTYRADGLIVATPTGSTAYSMAAGGPLISPLTHVYVITPICPHSLTDRSIVLSEKSVVELRSIDNEEEATIFTVDGRKIIQVAHGGRIEIRKSPHDINIIRLEDRSFFSTLRQKLSWG